MLACQLPQTLGRHVKHTEMLHSVPRVAQGLRSVRWHEASIAVSHRVQHTARPVSQLARALSNNTPAGPDSQKDKVCERLGCAIAGQLFCMHATIHASMHCLVGIYTTDVHV